MFRPVQGEHKGEPATFLCVHWKTWPPLQAFLDEDSASLRKSMSDSDYQRFQLWQSICGLRAMKTEKCLNCPHVRKVERTPPHPYMLVTLDGTHSVPVHDITTLSALPMHRGHLMKSARPDGSVHSKKDAAWVHREREEGDNG